MRLSGRATVRCLVVLALPLIGLAVIKLASASQSGVASIPAIPLRLGSWEGTDQAVDERTKGLLGTDQVLVREYRNSHGDAIWAAVVYAAENRSAFHPPELCYTSSNFELVEQGTSAVARNDRGDRPMVNRLLMTNRQQRLLAYYWFTAGDRFFTHYHSQQLQLVWNQIRRRPSGGTLVRISILIGEDGVASAEQRLSEIAALLMSAMQDAQSASHDV